MRVSMNWHNPNPDTVFNKLAVTLGREPTDAEAAEEVRRILREARQKREAA